MWHRKYDDCIVPLIIDSDRVVGIHKYEKLPNIVIHACKNNTEKNVFVEKFWPANLALFIYVSTHCVEKVKWLDYTRYSQLTRWCSGNASSLGARSLTYSLSSYILESFSFSVVVFMVVF